MTLPTILHLASSYAHNPLYAQLVNAIDAKGEYLQQVYVPVRTKAELDGYTSSNTNIQEHFSYVLRKYHRVFYFRKLHDIYSDLSKKVNLQNIDTVHAHYVFADGGVANKLFRKQGIPYIVTVRNVDIRLFFGKLLHLRGFGNRVMRDASRVVVLSESYREKLLQFVPKKHRTDINNKIIVLPNGIDEFWLKNQYLQKKEIKQKVNFAFVGEFTKNKNIDGAIAGIQKFQKKSELEVQLSVVGGTEEDYKKVYATQVVPSFVSFCGRINDREALKKILEQSHLFIMLSHTETFGLVYAEAMSQGCPVLYSKGQGFDKQFEEGEVGYAVLAENIDQIASRIEKLVRNYNEIQVRVSQLSNRFKWEDIGCKYADLYRKILY